MPKFGKHKHTSLIKDGSKKMREIINDPRFKARMAKLNSIPVISKYDVPYVCGYSVDAKKIYFDRHFKPIFRGKDLTKFLKIHEFSEKAAIDLFDLSYQQAHHLATYLEHQAVRAAGIDWNDYDSYIKPFIKKDHDEQLKVVPPDLDLTPYKDEPTDHALFTRLRSRERQHITETKISLEYHDTLNPKLWRGDVLKSEVREKLMDFANAWAKFAKIPVDIIQDVVIIGGNTNYNYTPFSDIDVHLVINRNDIGGDRELVDEYLQDKKVLWTLTHKVSVYGYSIEPYAQDSSQGYASGQGAYSILRDEWIQRPVHGGYDFSKDKNLKKKVMFYVKMIDSIIKDKMDADTVNNLKVKMREMRAAAISKGGEFSFENLVFKELRNRGYLDKLNKYEKSLKDQQLSLR